MTVSKFLNGLKNTFATRGFYILDRFSLSGYNQPFHLPEYALNQVEGTEDNTNFEELHSLSHRLEFWRAML